MRSLLIVVKEEFLAKGIALAMMEKFQSIHTTQNPFEALKIAANERIDLTITELKFKTLDSKSYLNKIVDVSKIGSTIILLQDDDLSVDKQEKELNIIIQQRPISIKNILNVIKSIKEKSFQKNNGE